jgi:hypothetical protein
MRLQYTLVVGIAVGALASAQTWTPPKTPWGDPDLQGVWPGTALLGVPMERPQQFGTRAYLTEQEFAEREAFAKKQTEIDTAQYVSRDPLVGRGGAFVKCSDDPERCANGVRIGPPNYWDERGTPNRRTSLIMDPPDGRIPPLTPEARKLAAERAAARSARPCSGTPAGCHDSWEDESLWDRCITRGTVGSIVPNTYNQGNQIVQAPGQVVLRNEMIHESRIIAVDGRPHLPKGIRTWMGDSRGHWEGNTLVVETTNFMDKTIVGQTPASENLRLVERFTRTSGDTLEYQMTIDDPETWTKPWTIAFPLKSEPDYVLYEYACHEGNYYMYNALKGARADEKAVAARGAKN